MGLRKGSERRSEVLKEGVIGIGGSVKVYIRVYKLPVNRTKT